MKVRGVMHAHSRQAQNEALSLSELKKSLFAHGISFCCVTEAAQGLNETTAAAFVAECRQLSDQAFVFIPGFEVIYKDVSLLLVGTSVFLGKRVDEAVLRSWREVTPLIFLARSTVAPVALDNTLLSLIDGVDVWNQRLDGAGAPLTKTLHVFNQLRGFKPELRAVGCVAHTESKNKFAPELVLEVDTPDVAEIIRQLDLGFYVLQSGRVLLASDGTLIAGGGFLTKLTGVGDRLLIFIRRLLKV